jgi:hypothetical protein
MISKKIPFDGTISASFFKACAGSKDIDTGQQILAHLVNNTSISLTHTALAHAVLKHRKL